MLPVRYMFDQGARQPQRLYVSASDARVLYDRGGIERAYRACQAELAAHPWTMPGPLRRLAAREAQAGQR